VQVDDNTQHRRGTRLLRSEDDGDTWTDITPDGPLRHAVVQSLKRSAEGMLIACSNLGLFGEDLGANVAIDDPFIGSAPPEAPVSFLGRNHPNPFNPRTTIPFALARPGAVRLEVYDLRGARRATLVDERLTAGRHEVEFDGRGLGSGTYMYRLEADGFVRSGRMTLVK
jgi:hypothetical protein